MSEAARSSSSNSEGPYDRADADSGGNRSSTANEGGSAVDLAGTAEAALKVDVERKEGGVLKPPVSRRYKWTRYF